MLLAIFLILSILSRIVADCHTIVDCGGISRRLPFNVRLIFSDWPAVAAVETKGIETHCVALTNAGAETLFELSHTMTSPRDDILRLCPS